MKKIKRSIVILIALGMIVSLAMVIPASAQTTREGRVKVQDSEFVFAEMDYTGEITGIQVFDWLELSGDGTVQVRESQSVEGDTSWQGVKGRTKPKTEGGYIVWPELSVDGPENVIANTKFSENMVEEAKMKIPLDVTFRFYFDGAPVTDIASKTGESGRFKMEVTFKNESAEMTEVEYEDPVTGEMVTEMVETHLPMVILPYDWYFDNSIFFNLEADPTGVVVWMPDFYNVGWSIPLFPPATGESHTISVSADVKNFQLPPLTLAVAFDFPQTNQEDPLVFIRPGMEQIYDGLKAVNEGVGTPDTADTLLYGITAVDDGLQQMAAGLPEAQAGLVNELIPGVDQAAAGIGSPTTPDTLLYATSATTAGLQSILSGIGSSSTGDTLLYAANAVAGGLSFIYDSIGSAGQQDTLLYAMDQMRLGLLQSLAGIGSPTTDPSLLFAMTQIQLGIDNPSGLGLLQGAAGIRDATAPGGDFDVVLQVIISLAQVLQATYPADPLPPQIITFTQLVQQGLTSPTPLPVPPFPEPYSVYLASQAMVDGIGSATTPDTLLYGVNEVINGLNLMAAGIGSATTPDTLLYAVAAVTGGLLAIQAGIGTATTPDTLQFAVAAIEAGLNSIKAGIGDAAVPDTLLYAVAAIQNGLYQIQKGLTSGNINDPGIKEGLILIAQGLNDAVTGLGSSTTPDTLLYGTNAVKSGLTDVGDGVGQLTDGVGSFVEAFNLTDAELEAIAMRGEEFDHLLGRAEDATNNVRLVYQMMPTYNYNTGNSTSWVVAIVLSVIIGLILIAGGIMLSRLRGTA